MSTHEAAEAFEQMRAMAQQAIDMCKQVTAQRDTLRDGLIACRDGLQGSTRTRLIAYTAATAALVKVGAA